MTHMTQVTIANIIKMYLSYRYSFYATIEIDVS
jgi:hypothetical protein